MKKSLKVAYKDTSELDNFLVLDTGRDIEHINKKLKEMFGINLEIYMELYNLQKGFCVICGKHEEPDDFVIDTYPEHNLIRSLLCIDCKNGLIKFKENIKVMETAVNYLRYAEKKLSEREKK